MRLPDTDLRILSIIEDTNCILYSQSFSMFLTMDLIYVKADELGFEWSRLTFKGWWLVYCYRQKKNIILLDFCK